MEAKELRIGNCILKNGSNYIVDTLFFVDVYDGTAMGFDLQPIPLTEEILLKCGFFDEGDFLELIINEDLSIIWVGYLGIMIGGSISLLFDRDTLYQLQNLYFALTNEELTVNL